MALHPGLFLLLWNLHVFLHGVRSSCNVSCSTDYRVSLNCSCSSPTYSGLLSVTCSGEDLVVTGSCEVKAPQSWCVMYPEKLDEVASIGTTCNATAGQQGGRVDDAAPPDWALSDVVKPSPPVGVRVTNANGFSNVTWNHGNREDCLRYRVRVRDDRDLSKHPPLSLSVTEKNILLDHETLSPRVGYTVDVQAQMCPGNLYIGPWSEWSSAAHWRTRGAHEGIHGLWWYVPPSLLLVLVLLLLGYFKKTWWQQKLQRMFYIPKAEEFFKPLHLSHGCSFKEWGKPVFSEYDYLRISPRAQMMSEEQHAVLQWSNEKQRYGEDSEIKPGGPFLHAPSFFQDGGSSQGTGHSTGHVSIHTVTLSGEEEFEERSLNSLRSFQDGERFGSSEEDHGEQAGSDLEAPRRQSGILPRHVNQMLDDSMENINFEPRGPPNEPERLSLNSNEQSEDCYPRVDLDTIDSGFGECGSPGASDSNAAEHMHSDLFPEHRSLNSNYVKQWMTCQDGFGSSETELQETT
ncbi:interleukin 21 receptor, tandem duplicate 1 isoform X2 [Cyclopterus lumpus]|uniref:interleukin 21 receptor, tandem duplicate 1 isoform X2 n=1 Tax=Cyclopterus lumpus TaxID=8103 RepID=UPI001485F8B0|nr:interleukin 21 receptor, tandem duplicate 1 isoform X2 [Cyclopterus lumpus]